MFKFILFFSIISSGYAQNIVPLEKGQAAPFSGALVSKEQIKSFRLINEQKKALENQKITLEDLNEVNNKRIDFYKNETEDYKKLIQKERSKRFWSNTGYFILGVAATGLAAYAAIQATR